MKKIETIMKNASAMTEEEILALVANENVASLSETEKVSVLVFEELKKSLNTATTELLMDCNYEHSNFVHKTEKQLEKGQSPEYRVDYFRLISKLTGKSLIQFYAQVDMKHSKVHFRLATSCAKLVLEQFEALEDELMFTTKRTKEGKARWSERKNIPYEEVSEVAKNVVDVLTTANRNAVAEKAAREEERKAKRESEKQIKQAAKELAKKVKEEVKKEVKTETEVKEEVKKTASKSRKRAPKKPTTPGISAAVEAEVLALA